MAKPVIADIDLPHGGRVLKLRLSTLAIGALQDAWGLESFDAVLQRMMTLGTGRIGDFADMLWAALRRHHPEIGREEAAEILDDLGIQALFEALKTAMDAAMPDAGEGEAGPKAAVRPPARGQRTASSKKRRR